MRVAVDAHVQDGVGDGVGQYRAAGASAGVVPHEHHGLGAGLQTGEHATAGPDASGRWQESRTPFHLSARTVRLRVLVDRTSVEMFVDDGRYAHSTVVFPDPSDTGLALFTIDGQAVFRNMVIREFAV
ncbi:GH32 C-terminal domain-containing protein [Nonomuraea sp. NPDC049695]|uniref:GH32 C-terminal domain-containing protein n=1 Tax=Nonomuraea sp. NPDC049695 TaxID=3154734 RepID=UPI0034343E75